MKAHETRMSPARGTRSGARFLLYTGMTLGTLLLLLISSYVFSTNAYVSAVFPATTQVGAAEAATVPADFHYHFSTNGVLNESQAMSQSTSPYFWLNSGGVMLLEDGVGKTAQGALQTTNFWRILYNVNNALDTGAGYFPQNLFRLITKSTWDDVQQQVRFKITHLNMTDTSNRDGWSGVLLMSRYQDQDNLYYAGVRMDGTAVIKKKRNGVYTTLASARVFNADAQFNRDTNPNLIPGNVWMGLRSRVTDRPDGGVEITLWIDKNDTNTWTQILTATDTTSVVTGPAYAGIRTDYLDLLFDDYKLTEL